MLCSVDGSIPCCCCCCMWMQRGVAPLCGVIGMSNSVCDGCVCGGGGCVPGGGGCESGGSGGG
eukprot:1663292-Karenia_brevis.AAC.1